MAITSFTQTSIGENTWLLQATSGLSSPTFYWFKDGELFSTTEDGQKVVSLDPSEAASFEVLDTSTGATAESFSGRVTLIWQETPTAVDRFVVERYDGAEWQPEATIQSNPVGYYRFTSSVLDDSQTHQIRITPVKHNTDGAVRTSNVLIVRRPPPPTSFTASFDNVANELTGTITE